MRVLSVICPIAASLAPWPAAPADFNPAEVAKKALPAVVAIRVKTASGEASGSGFVVDSSGTIITNLHVVRGATQAAVRVANGDIYDKMAIRAFDERKDLAVVQISAFGLPTVQLGNSDGLEPGQRVVLVGNPLGVLEGSVSTGVVSAVRTLDEGYKVIQTDATANHGNSGGPMLDEKGEVVGVVTFKVGEGKAENLNFAVPINYARGMLSSTESLSLRDLDGRLGKATDLFSRQAGLPTRWRSLATGTTKILRNDGDNLYVETILPDEQKSQGAFSLAELKKSGDRYVGRGRASLVCSYMTGLGVYRHEELNRCTDDYEIEISLLSPTRIEGTVGDRPKGTRLDCKKCRFSTEARVRNAFTWIPE